MADALDPFALFRLDAQVVVVTGASSGLGTRLARVAGAAGARVVLAARRVDRLDSLAAELPEALAVQCDVADDADRRRLVASTIERFGRVDVLVNNAGVSGAGTAYEETEASYRATLETNLVAPFALAQLAAASMRDAGGGVIVNVASILAFVGSGSTAASYNASKAGLVGLTRELAVQWARDGIRVNALAPGYFRTEMNESVMDDERFLAWMRRKTPMRRIGDEGELDGAFLFLASAASSFVTGQIVVVDGGWLAS